MTNSIKKILIVEDEEALSDVLEDALKSEGFEVTLARDGAEGLEAALSQQPNIILLDIVMPKLSGLEMLKQLRATDEGKDIPVVILTNLNDAKEVSEAMLHGARDYLVKSDWSISDLVDSVRKHLV